MTSPNPQDFPPIVVGYDGSDSARRAVAMVGSLFAGRRVIVVTAWTGLAETNPELLIGPGGVLLAAAGAVSDVMHERAQELATEGAQLAVEAGLTAEGRTAHGRHAVWQGLLEAADEWDAGLVVVGSRGQSRIVAAVLGSVSSGVLHHSTRPVLVVPADEDAQRERAGGR